MLVQNKASTKPSYAYSEINNTPTLGTASAKDIPSSGDAGEDEVVLGNDSRLTDARPASDVSEWAKADSKPSYAYSEIQDTPTLGTAAAKDIPESGNASTTQVVMGNDTRLSDARTPTSHTHTKSEITDFPTLGTAAAKNVPSSGNASTTEVVMGNDTRLTDSRPASDVSSWAKASTKPTYAYSEIQDAPTLGTAAAKDVATSGDASTTQVVMGNDTRLTDARTPKSHTHTKSEITDFPTLGTAAAKDVPSSGNASTTQVVMGNDSRLTDARNANDVYSWAKASTKPSYSASEISGLGTAAAKNFTTSVTQNSTDLVTSGAVWSAIDNLPEPMILKGTLGTGGTITSLPTASASNEGYTYKVITAGTYASQAAKVGDFFVSCKPEGATSYSWVWFPSGDESFTDTWRNIKVNGTEKLGTGISSGAVDFVNGTNTTVEFDTSGNKVSISVPAVSSSSAGVAPKGATVSSQSQTTKFLREDGLWAAPSYTTNTDTKVTSSANHYTPSTASGQDKTASASGASAAWSIDVVKGVTLNTDGKGHVTGLSVTSGKVPANPNTDRYVNSAAFADDSSSNTNSPVKMTLTRAGSDTGTVTANIPKVSSSSAGVVPKGAAVSSQSQTTKFLREDGSWAAPSYSTVNNATLTIQKNGTNVQTFTANQSSNATANITVPTKTSEISNDSNFFSTTGGYNQTLQKGNASYSYVYFTTSDNVTKTAVGYYNNVGSFLSNEVNYNYIGVDSDGLFETLGSISNTKQRFTTRSIFDFVISSETNNKWYCALYRGYDDTNCWRGILTVSSRQYSYTPGYSESFMVVCDYRNIRMIPFGSSGGYYVDWITNWRVGQDSSNNYIYLDFQCINGLVSPTTNNFRITVVDLTSSNGVVVPTALAASQVSTVQYTVSNTSLICP